MQVSGILKCSLPFFCLQNDGNIKNFKNTKLADHLFKRSSFQTLCLIINLRKFKTIFRLSLIPMFFFKYPVQCRLDIDYWNPNINSFNWVLWHSTRSNEWFLIQIINLIMKSYQFNFYFLDRRRLEWGWKGRKYMGCFY